MILLLLFLIIVSPFLYLIYRIIAYILKSEKRIKIAGIVVAVCFAGLIVKKLFFEEMYFIQSNVYPDLYLIRYPKMDSVETEIRKVIDKRLKEDFIGKETNFIEKYKSKTKIWYYLQFYEYYKGPSVGVPFGIGGTAHFIDNKADPGGWSSEELHHYDEYELGNFEVKFYENDTINYYGILNLYHKEQLDTIIKGKVQY